jgi:hypothetical protein
VVLDAVAAESCAGAVREQRLVRSAGAFGYPCFEDGADRWDQRRASCFAAFADRVHVGAGAECDVLTVQGDEFGDPQAGLDRQREHRVVTTAGLGGRVAGGQERVDFWLGEVGQQVLLSAFGWDRKNPGDRVGALGMLQREVGEERVDRREPVVAGPGLVAAVGLAGCQERGDQRRVEIGDVEPAGWCAGALLGEAQQ